jgi:hypothetical protein
MKIDTYNYDIKAGTGYNMPIVDYCMGETNDRGAVLVIADGSGQGKEVLNATKRASIAALRALSEQTAISLSFADLLVAMKRSILLAHTAIVQSRDYAAPFLPRHREPKGACTLMLGLVAHIQSNRTSSDSQRRASDDLSNRALILGSMGDCSGFVYSPKSGKVRMISVMPQMHLKEQSDSWGQLGWSSQRPKQRGLECRWPHETDEIDDFGEISAKMEETLITVRMNLAQVDEGQLSFYACRVEKGDIVFMATDGIVDNTYSNSIKAESLASFVGRIEETLQGWIRNAATPEKLCERIVGFLVLEFRLNFARISLEILLIFAQIKQAIRVTAPYRSHKDELARLEALLVAGDSPGIENTKRTFFRMQNDFVRSSHDFKPDHATIIAYQVT